MELYLENVKAIWKTYVHKFYIQNLSPLKINKLYKKVLLLIYIEKKTHDIFTLWFQSFFKVQLKGRRENQTWEETRRGAEQSTWGKAGWVLRGILKSLICSNCWVKKWAQSFMIFD